MAQLVELHYVCLPYQQAIIIIDNSIHLIYELILNQYSYHMCCKSFHLNIIKLYF